MWPKEGRPVKAGINLEELRGFLLLEVRRLFVAFSARSGGVSC